MADINMKKVIIVTLLLVMNLSAVKAAPLAKPSFGQIKKMIKKMVLKTTATTFTGINPYGSSKCENTKVSSIKLLKVGRVTSNYYGQSGFMVKFFIEGSCIVNPPYKLNEELGEKMPMNLGGRLPFRGNIAYATSFITDSYGDWYAQEVSGPIDITEQFYKKKTKKYLKGLFYRNNKASVKAWNKEQTILKNRMSDQAELGCSVMKFDSLYTPEVDAQLRSQPKRTREFVCSTYEKSVRRRDYATSTKFLKEVIAQMKLKAARSQSPNSKSARKPVNHSLSNNSHSHGGRIHSHKLPTQGKSHRHRNGPIGR